MLCLFVFRIYSYMFVYVYNYEKWALYIPGYMGILYNLILTKMLL